MAGWKDNWEDQWQQLLQEADRQIRKTEQMINRLDGQTYRDEPIRKPSGSSRKRQKEQLPAKLQEFLKTFRNGRHSASTGFYALLYPRQSYRTYEDPGKRFIRQAQFMADYEDDVPYTDPAETIFWPTYDDFDVPQLRGYFTWRTRLRRGEVPDAPLSFQYLYIYELLNQVGTDSVEDGYRRLQQFMEHYGSQKGGIGLNLQEWLFDYVLYYHMDVALLWDAQQVIYDNALSVLLHMEEHTEQEVVDAASLLGTYNAKKSKFAKAYPELFANVTCRVLRKFVDYYARHRKNGFWESLFGVQGNYSYEIFSRAVFYDWRRQEPERSEDFICEVDPMRTYRCKKGRWSCQGYFSIERSKLLGQILRAVDSNLREVYAYPDTIQNRLDIKYMRSMIDHEVLAYYKEKRKEEQQREEAERKAREAAEAAERERLRLEEERKAHEVHLDLGKLDEIRRAAAVTQQRLMTEEDLAELAALDSEGSISSNTVSRSNKDDFLQNSNTQAYIDTGENQYSANHDRMDAGNREQKTSNSLTTVQELETTNSIDLQQVSDHPITNMIKAGNDTNRQQALDYIAADTDATRDHAGLPYEQWLLLHSLLYGGDYMTYFREHKLLLSVVAEAVNEHFFDEIGDSVIEFDGEDPVLVEDYRDDLTERIQA